MTDKVFVLELFHLPVELPDIPPLAMNRTPVRCFFTPFEIGK